VGRGRITPERDAVVTEVFISAPPERVFEALIGREQALKWGSTLEFVLTKWEMDPRIGGKWVLSPKSEILPGTMQTSIWLTNEQRISN
jgi:uncharacterized protein YndB with AHSA1/START domain